MIEFEDVDSGERSFVVVRRMEDTVYLALSIEHNGDIEVCFSAEVALRIAQALHEVASS